MLGTLAAALEVRGIKLEQDAIAADARGFHGVVDSVIRLTKIEIDYTLRVPAGSRETVDRALARHQEKCPMARTLERAIEITWRADIREA
jgi:organic hydroperoxide reductase OsmC/OhrA